jgi:hypothetical protein
MCGVRGENNPSPKASLRELRLRDTDFSGAGSDSKASGLRFIQYVLTEQQLHSPSLFTLPLPPYPFMHGEASTVNS